MRCRGLLRCTGVAGYDVADSWGENTPRPGKLTSRKELYPQSARKEAPPARRSTFLHESPHKGVDTLRDTTRTNRRRKMRAQLRSNLEPRKVLGTRAVSRARAHPDHLEHFRVSLSPLEIIRRQVCLGVRPGCLERFRLFRGRLKSSRAARLSRAASGYLEHFRLS